MDPRSRPAVAQGIPEVNFFKNVVHNTQKQVVSACLRTRDLSLEVMDTVAEKSKIDARTTSLIENMFKVGAHYGYSKTRRHPSFISLLFGSKEKVDIIDLEITSSYLARATEFIEEYARAGKVILFVGTKPEARQIIEELVVPLGVPYVTHRWIGGMLTNFSEIKRRIARLEELQTKTEKGELNIYTKRERLLLERERQDLEKNFGGIAHIKQTPHALFLIDPKKEKTAVREAFRKKIPVVALAGSDCNLGEIAYSIPANDSSIASIRFFVEKIVEAHKRGMSELIRQREEAQKEEAKEATLSM